MANWSNHSSMAMRATDLPMNWQKPKAQHPFKKSFLSDDLIFTTTMANWYLILVSCIWISNEISTPPHLQLLFITTSTAFSPCSGKKAKAGSGCANVLSFSTSCPWLWTPSWWWTLTQLWPGSSPGSTRNKMCSRWAPSLLYLSSRNVTKWHQSNASSLVVMIIPGLQSPGQQLFFIVIPGIYFEDQLHKIHLQDHG